MNVLHVIPSFAPAWRYGGPIVSTLGLTRELVRQGHEVNVATTNINGRTELDVPLNEPVLVDGVQTWYFPVQHPRWYHFSIPMGKRLKQLVSQSEIVHIHSLFLWPTTAAAFWCRRLQVPYVLRTAGFLDQISMAKRYSGLYKSLTSRAKKWAYLNTIGKGDIGHAAALHFTSNAEMESAQRLNLSPKGYVLPLGIDLPTTVEPSSENPFLKRYPQLNGKKIVLFLSRLDPIKGLDILAEALSSLSEKRRDFLLVIAGTGNLEYENDLHNLFDRYGLSNAAIFAGMVGPEEKWDLLNIADIFVLPSRHENFGVAVLEAMATGTPVVISDQVGIHKEISAVGAGLVTGLNPKQLKTAVERILDDPAEGAEMGRAGKSLVQKRFLWEQVGSDVARLYGQITNQASKDRVNVTETDPE